GGKEKTAREVSIEAQRDAITRSGWLKRFFGQFGDEITIIANKAGNPDTKDEEAVKLRELLAEKYGVTDDDWEDLTHQHQGQMIDDLTTARTQALVQGM